MRPEPVSSVKPPPTPVVALTLSSETRVTWYVPSDRRVVISVAPPSRLTAMMSTEP